MYQTSFSQDFTEALLRQPEDKKKLKFPTLRQGSEQNGQVEQPAGLEQDDEVVFTDDPDITHNKQRVHLKRKGLAMISNADLAEHAKVKFPGIKYPITETRRSIESDVIVRDQGQITVKKDRKGAHNIKRPAVLDSSVHASIKDEENQFIRQIFGFGSQLQASEMHKKVLSNSHDLTSKRRGPLVASTNNRESPLQSFQDDDIPVICNKPKNQKIKISQQFPTINDKSNRNFKLQLRNQVDTDIKLYSEGLQSPASKRQAHHHVGHLHFNSAKKEDSLNEIRQKELNNTLSIQEDLDKIEKLSIINASARFELLNVNQQLIDFQMNRFIKYDKRQKKIAGEQKAQEVIKKPLK